ncbi:MAG: C40 family peptidase [Thiotrichaceae bacterium]
MKQTKVAGSTKFNARTTVKLSTLSILTVLITSCSQVPYKPNVQNQLPSGSSSPTHSQINSHRNNVVQSTYRTLGSPYRYGGTTYNGFDCSGLTRHVYQSAGIAIPRTAAQQRDQSKTIANYSALLPGDLIFFKTGKKTNHVGIFVGNGQFIHASTSRKRVIKAKLDTPYWRRSFVKFGTYIR